MVLVFGFMVLVFGNLFLYCFLLLLYLLLLCTTSRTLPSREPLPGIEILDLLPGVATIHLLRKSTTSWQSGVLNHRGGTSIKEHGDSLQRKLTH